ncbi:minor capsid protein [Ligilactobacillus agilis]|uniref:minor capsid protein n=1 Tax=Ligilactobacillus agilis TaxID=1601 RepID=UPI00195EA70F|nr:minor capsid protein [Ligilactobacillus agilis]MBM6773063.1 minor capsid protein [Ligilactobacillus agilis]
MISKEVTNSRYAAERIARTESARVQTQAQLKSFRDYGYKFCKWHAEPSACKICREISENDSGYGVSVYRVDEVPSLPAHPNCRCAVGAYWVDEKETIARAPYSNKSFNDMLDSVNGISKKDVKEIKKNLNQAPEDIQNMFHKYAGFVKWITFDNNNTSGFYYLTKRINFVPDQFMGKNRDYKKYDIFFHEFAHAIDYFYGNHKYFSKNSKIRDALFNDYQNLRDSITLKESIAATQRLLGETKFSELYMDKTNQKSKILLSLNSRKLTLARDELGNFTSD